MIFYFVQMWSFLITKFWKILKKGKESVKAFKRRADFFVRWTGSVGDVTAIIFLLSGRQNEVIEISNWQEK